MKYAAGTHKGMIRDNNEDCYNIIAGITGMPVSFVIADGMGGHNSGEIASRMAVDLVGESLLQLQDVQIKEEPMQDLLKKIVIKANNEIFSKSQKSVSDSGMGTTLIIAVIYGSRLYAAHIGDSRLYLIREGSIRQITNDHSYIGELLKYGSITLDEAETHPNRHMITRALGCSELIETDIYLYDIIEKDIIILCTDGLTNMLSNEEIKEIAIEHEDPEVICNKLIDSANKKGGIDNTTVIIIKT